MNLNTEYDFIRRVQSDESDDRFYEGIKILEDKSEQRLWCRPSVTYKLKKAGPTEEFLIDYIRSNGLHGEIQFKQAGNDGTEVHVAIDRLIKGEALPSSEMKPKVKKCVQAFIDWYRLFKPKIISTESMVVSHEYNFAGTYDLLAEVDYKEGRNHYQGVYLIDYKSSRSIHDTHKMQNSAYWKTFNRPDFKTALLHLGNTTKAHFSFIDFDPNEYWERFESINKTFELTHPNLQPSIITYPDLFIL